MTGPLQPIERQVRRASQRLFAQTLMDCLAWSWAGALLLAACWFLLQPLAFPAVEGHVRWAIAGGLFAAATVLAVALARRLAPSRLDAALALDRRFDLRERITTSLSLTPAEQHSPAAVALLADATRHVGALDVPSRFPLRLNWSAALVPACGGLLALVAFLPDLWASAGPDGGLQARQQTSNPKEIEEKVDRLKKALAKLPKDELKSEKLKELEKDLEKLLQQPLDPRDKDQVRDRLKALQPVEEKMKERVANLKAKKDKAQQIRDQLKNLDRADPKGDKDGPKDGLAKDLKDALAKGNLDKAADEVERLRKKLEDPKLDAKERQQIEDQLRDLEQRLKRLADMQDMKDQLQKAFDKGELAREEFDQRLEDLAEAMKDLQDLKDLADALGECLKCMKKGDKMALGKNLKLLRGKLCKLDPNEKELKDLEENEALLLEMRLAMCRGLQGNQQGNMQGNGLAGGGPPGQRRPMGKDGKTDYKGLRQRVPEEDKGELRISGFRRGGTFSRIPAREVGGAFRQAQQDAPGAIERQRVPPDAAEIITGYYDNLVGNKNK